MTTWIRRWKAEIAKTKLPGVWKLRSGGHLVRARATEAATGRIVEIRKRLPDADEAQAFGWLEEERRKIRDGGSGRRARQRFADFATSLMEQKIALRNIKSARGREKWRNTLTHLIGGTGPVHGFGEIFVDALRPAHIETWKLGIAQAIASGSYAPTTCNTWLGILKVITRAARRQLELPIDPAEDIPFFDTSEHEIYPEEEPNSLTAEEARAFLSAMRSEFPQHYAMTALGFVTGFRPSMLRPLRRSGPKADVLWTEGKILVRRSHTRPSKKSIPFEVMDMTKSGIRYRVHVPPEVLSILRWHIDTQLVTPEQQDSDLLFPAEDGRIRSESALKKPFAACAAICGLRKRITPKAMRRTFNDLTRAARVEGIVTRSISGHLTTEMQEHYSTVSPKEQREALRGVLRLIKGGAGAPRARRVASR